MKEDEEDGANPSLERNSSMCLELQDIQLQRIVVGTIICV